MALEFARTLFLSLCFFVPAADSNDCDDGNFCLNSGTCSYDQHGHGKCQCPTWYTGKHCEHGEPCKHIVCQHGGTCNERDGRCQCQAGFVGDLCEVVDSCDDHIICYNGGSCYFNNSVNVAACRCPVDFTGYRCERQISTTTTTSHVTNPPSTATASNHPQTSVSTTRNPACAKYDPGSRACIDNSACGLLHVKEVICPDPNEAHYCPITCGCCLPASHTAAVVG
ncbi:notch homolog 2 N-terminal-like protein B [Dreissena polymorpha]|uniref:EGF-like domain-containing protein n=1 Tax=Dreissena polymorpha TaxID=45954 RepID=A0A9D4LLT6_DREPO|nr:notch homolog 2 N-terminal-like protein B [Dreissena polymorpha]KAH3860079.1 hypothetical protein DPMN_022972 [Dreissena polymorpha]